MSSGIRPELHDAAPPPLSTRRIDIDWLRIIAMFLLIVTHTIFLYTTTWRLESSHAGHWGDVAAMVMGPWRMALVFFIGGVATRFLLTKHNLSGFTANRLHRLILPFIVSVIFIIPPMNYVRLDNIGAPDMSYLEFLRTHWHSYDQLFGVWLPDLGPSWFLPYLFTFAVGSAALWKFGRDIFSGVEEAIGSSPIEVLLVIVCAGYVFSNRGVLLRLGLNENLVHAFADTIHFLPEFLIGLFVAQSRSFWARLQKVRFTLWRTAGLLLVATLLATAVSLKFGADDAPVWTYALLPVAGLYAGVMIFSVLAAGARSLTRPSPALNYFSDAILPVYLIHQTIIVLVADRILDDHLPLALEFLVIFAAAFAIPLLIHHLLIRPFPWIRLAFGLRPHPKPSPPKETAAPSPASPAAGSSASPSH